MRKNDGWTNALIALIFIAVPALIGFYFLLPDWNGKETTPGLMWGVALGFIGYVVLLSVIFIFTKILTIESLNFNIPITFVFSAIFVTYGLPIWSRALIVIAIILMTFPVNILVSNLKHKVINKNKSVNNHKKNNSVHSD